MHAQKTIPTQTHKTKIQKQCSFGIGFRLNAFRKLRSPAVRKQVAKRLKNGRNFHNCSSDRAFLRDALHVAGKRSALCVCVCAANALQFAGVTFVWLASVRATVAVTAQLSICGSLAAALARCSSCPAFTQARG